MKQVLLTRDQLHELLAAETGKLAAKIAKDSGEPMKDCFLQCTWQIYHIVSSTVYLENLMKMILKKPKNGVNNLKES